MIIESDISRADFIVKVLSRDLANIYNAQKLIVTRNIYMEGSSLKMRQREGAAMKAKTGSLLEALEHPDYHISGAEGRFNVIANYPLHIRFLDMKKRGNWRIYNRVVWGILYNNSLRDLFLNYGKVVYDYVANNLESAFDLTKGTSWRNQFMK